MSLRFADFLMLLLAYVLKSLRTAKHTVDLFVCLFVFSFRFLLRMHTAWFYLGTFSSWNVGFDFVLFSFFLCVFFLRQTNFVNARFRVLSIRVARKRVGCGISSFVSLVFPTFRSTFFPDKHIRISATKGLGAWESHAAVRYAWMYVYVCVFIPSLVCQGMGQWYERIKSTRPAKKCSLVLY